MAAALLTLISGFLSVEDVWGDEWHVLAVSLQVRLARGNLCSQGFHRARKGLRTPPLGAGTGPGWLRLLPSVLTDRGLLVCRCFQSTAPFLHLLALASVTAASWLVAGFAIRRQRPRKN